MKQLQPSERKKRKKELIAKTREEVTFSLQNTSRVRAGADTSL